MGPADDDDVVDGRGGQPCEHTRQEQALLRRPEARGRSGGEHDCRDGHGRGLTPGHGRLGRSCRFAGRGGRLDESPFARTVTSSSDTTGV
jgi:hypothetical protein